MWKECIKTCRWTNGEFRWKMFSTDATGCKLYENFMINKEIICFDQDTFILLTPGGGGYGKVDDEHENKSEQGGFQSFIERGSLFDYRLAQEGV